MRGHLGFKCRGCTRASAPTITSGYVYDTGPEYRQYISWTAPASSGSMPILGYLVYRNDENTGAWIPQNQTLLQLNEMGVGYWDTTWCHTTGLFRVAAVTGCGVGAFSNAAMPGVPSGLYSTQTFLYTQSTTVYVPCAAYSVKIWAVGKGGTWPGGGAGGGLVWKAWSYQSRNTSYAFDQIGVSITPTESSAVFNGATITAYAGSAFTTGGYSGGDGGAYGNPGGDGYQAYSGQPYASITYPFSGTAQYSGNYVFGGGIGGSSGTYPGGSAIRPLPVSPCRRHPANDNAGLLAAVALAGGRVTEECVTQAAFGSGAVSFTMSTYGGTQRVDFAAGYGGGGFDSTNPGGAGAVVVQFSE